MSNEVSASTMIEEFHRKMKFDLENMSNFEIEEILDEKIVLERNLEEILNLTKESFVKVPNFLDENDSTPNFVVRSNELLEKSIKRIKQFLWRFLENFESIRTGIDLNLFNSINKNEQREILIEMQRDISKELFQIESYFRKRSQIAQDLFDEPQNTDVWLSFIELDKDCSHRLQQTCCHLNFFFHRFCSWISEEKQCDSR